MNLIEAYTSQCDVTVPLFILRGLFSTLSQAREDGAGRGAPGLQGDRGAQRRPVVHGHPGAVVPPGEGGLDQRHQPGTWPPAAPLLLAYT